MHELPLSFMDYDGFRDVLDFLAMNFIGMSRNTLKSEVLKLYEVKKSRTMMILDENTSRIDLTTDMWTSLDPEDEISRGEVMDEDDDITNYGSDYQKVVLQ
ncbi:hypothetical protein Dsin_016023 [Dipteronia sinensis]|uniref:Uncharacterized protein n=1 Tax=Dipteronia sinensis TaxID=43782 RepID=A0AAE0ADI2_9ROSI|nr:hypothetical protein Dsin_016023 [Dipteronia sinensis]